MIHPFIEFFTCKTPSANESVPELWLKGWRGGAQADRGAWWFPWCHASAGPWWAECLRTAWGRRSCSPPRPRSWNLRAALMAKVQPGGWTHEGMHPVTQPISLDCTRSNVGWFVGSHLQCWLWSVSSVAQTMNQPRVMTGSNFKLWVGAADLLHWKGASLIRKIIVVSNTLHLFWLVDIPWYSHSKRWKYWLFGTKFCFFKKEAG